MRKLPTEKQDKKKRVNVMGVPLDSPYHTLTPRNYACLFKSMSLVKRKMIQEM